MTAPIHPVVVHFPIALLIMAAILAILALIIGREKLRAGIFWVLLFGLLMGGVAILSGLQEEKSHEGHLEESAHELMETHETTGLIIGGLFLIVFLWFAIRQKKMTSGEYLFWLAFLLVSCGVLVYQGYTGGELVFQHGLGVEAAGGHSH